MKKIGFLLLLSVICLNLTAQFRYGYFKVGATMGLTHYLGDLDDDFTFKFTHPGFGATGAYKFHPHMEVRFSFYQGWIGAKDKGSGVLPRKERNLSFRSPITEGAATLVFDMFPEKRGYRFRQPFNPYVFAGIGVFKFNPQAKLQGKWYDLQPLGTEGQYLTPAPGKSYPKPYALTQICIPMGVGAHIMLDRKWSLDVETGFRKLFTDYLDDVSTRYPDLVKLQASNPIAAALSYRGSDLWRPVITKYIRGDKKQADWYIYTGVTATYIIDWVKCPKFGKPARRRY